jgi:hypothetical protein
MFWFRRPPYGRWVAAAALLVVAFVMDTSGRATEPRPFAAHDLAAGHVVTDEDVEWRDVPAGLLPAPDLAGATVGRSLIAGEPIVPGALRSAGAVPAGWWAVPLTLPTTIGPGAPVQVVDLSTGAVAGGIVVTPGGEGAFGVAEPGLVALPGEAAATMAVAAARDEVAVLFAPAG